MCHKLRNSLDLFWTLKDFISDLIVGKVIISLFKVYVQ